MKIPGLICAALCLMAGSALAHVTANPDHGVAGDYVQTSLRVSHGCEGSDTVSVQVNFPPGLLSVKPEHKDGWKTRIETRKLGKPVPGPHGQMADQEIASITWSGGVLKDSEFDNFGLLLKLPDAGGTLWLPVVQTCRKGKNEWTQIPAHDQEWHDLKSPAPFLRVEDAQPSMHDHHGH